MAWSLGDDYDVVVIGAGLGGLAAAATLTTAGARVLVLEQHNVPGGFATSFVRGRFEFEASLHELSGVGPAAQPGAVRRFLEDELGVHVDWCAVPEAYRLILTDKGVDARLPFGVEAFIDAVERAVPGSRLSVTRYIELCRDVAHALRVLATLGPSPSPGEVVKRMQRLARGGARGGDVTLALRRAGAFLRTLGRTVDDVTSEMALPPGAVDLLYPYWCYLGIPTSRLDFIIWAGMLVEYLELGAYVPRLRSQGLSEAIAERIRARGGRIEFGTRVERILVRDGHVEGVETSAGDRIRVGQVISNATPTTVYATLIQPPSASPDRARRLVNARRAGASAFAVYLGLDASPDELGIEDYGYMIAPHMNTDLLYASAGRLEVPEAQATICLNRAVPDCSPPGTTILSITALFKPGVWDQVAPADHVRVKNRLAAGLVRNFEQATGVSIQPHIEEVEVATPVTFARYAAAPRGSIYGYELDPWDSVIPRALAAPGEQFVRGLTFAGGHAALAHGFSSALLSGREAARSVMRRLEVTA